MPESARDRTLVYVVARGTAAFIWFYHGLVPKLLFHDRSELDLRSRIGTPPEHLRTAATLAGVVEVGFALLLIMTWRHSWPLWVTIVLRLVGIPVVAATAPDYLSAAFNPATLNLSLAALTAIALVARRDLPTAVNCRRQPDKGA